MTKTNRLAAVMFTDLVGYTELMSSDTPQALNELQKNRLLHKKYIKLYNGTWIKEIGDGILAFFDSSMNALACAYEIQNEGNHDLGLKLRIGIHLGEIIVDGGDIYGDGVNVAARIESKAPAGTICCSQAVVNTVSGQSFIKFQHLKQAILKGKSKSTDIYLLSSLDLNQIKPGTTKKNSKSTSYRWLTIVLIFLALVAYFFSNIGGQNPSNDGIELGFSQTQDLPDLSNKTVAVIPFSYQSNDPEFSHLGIMCGDWIGRAMQSISDITIFPSKYSTLEEILADTDGLHFAICGNIFRLDDTLIVSPQIVDLMNNETYLIPKITSHIKNINAVVEAVTQTIAGYWMVSDDVQSGKFSIPNYTAYQHFISALDKGLSEAMVNDHLYSAVNLDPSFHLARIFLYDFDPDYNLADSVKQLFNPYEQFIFSLTDRNSLDATEKCKILDEMRTIFPNDLLVNVASLLMATQQKNIMLFENTLEKVRLLDRHSNNFSNIFYPYIPQMLDSLQLINLYYKRDYPNLLASINDIPFDKRTDNEHVWKCRMLVRMNQEKELLQYLDSILNNDAGISHSVSESIRSQNSHIFRSLLKNKLTDSEIFQGDLLKAWYYYLV